MTARKQDRKVVWIWISGGVVLFLAALVFSLKDGGGGGTAGGSPLESRSGDAEGPEPKGPEVDDSRPGRTRSGSDRGSKTDADKGPRFPLVDAVLEDETLTNHESALRLKDIVLTAAAPESERLEALAHGLNLDFMAFKDIVRTGNLPESVAARYLTELSNQNEFRAVQVEGFLDLMDHPSEAIRADAVDRLSFLVENEELATDAGKLKSAARDYLEKLRLAGTPEKVADPSAAGEPADAPPVAPPPADRGPEELD